MLAENGRERWHEDDIPHRLRGLRVDAPAVAAQLLPYAHVAGVEVDLRPDERQELGETEAGEDGGRDQRPVSRRRLGEQLPISARSSTR